MTRHTRQDGSGRMERQLSDSRHILIPLRILQAVAPSGAHITLLKYGDDGAPQVSWYQGNLTEAEDMTFWKAKRKAERPGLDNWNEARRILTDAHWTVDP